MFQRPNEHSLSSFLWAFWSYMEEFQWFELEGVRFEVIRFDSIAILAGMLRQNPISIPIPPMTLVMRR